MNNQNSFMGASLVTLCYIFGGIQIILNSIYVLICAFALITTNDVGKILVDDPNIKNADVQINKVMQIYLIIYLVATLICLICAIMFVVGISKKNKCLLIPYLGLLALSLFTGAIPLISGLYGVFQSGSFKVFCIYLLIVLFYGYHVIQFVCGIKLKDSEHFHRQNIIPDVYVPQHNIRSLSENGVPIPMENPPPHKY